MAELHAYRVGQRYNADKASWPEATQYAYRAGGHELLLFMRNASAREVKAVKSGQVDLGFYAEGEQLLLLYRIGDGFAWSDAPFSVHRVAPDERTIPPPLGLAEPHALLTIILVEATTGVIRAIRVVGMTPHFTVALHGAIQRQAALPYDAASYDAGLDALYRRFPTVEAMLSHALEMRAARTGKGDAP